MPARAITPSPVDRLARVARRAGLRDFQSAVQLVSHSNDAWAIGEVILRICWRGDLARLRREALLLSHLPDAISHPPVLDFGEAEDLTWMVTRRLDGQILFEAWESLEAEHRHRMIAQLAEALCELHRWEPPAVVRAAFDEQHQPMPSSPEGIIGRFLVPLPVKRTRLLLAGLRALPHVPEALVGTLAERLDELEGDDPFSAGDQPFVVVHGDAHLRNVLVDNDRVVALFDFEWSRLAPAVLELETMLRYSLADIGDIFRAFRDGYPQLFDHANLISQLRLFELVFLARQILAWPLEQQLVRRLERAMASADRISALVERATHLVEGVWSRREPGAVEEQALVVADRSGVIRLWNEHATAMFGHSEADAVGSTLDLIVPELSRDRHWAGYRRAWDEGISDVPRVVLLPVLCADGEVRHFAGRLLPVRGPRGELAAMAGIWSPPSDQDVGLPVIA